jgi:outer membrane protein insertion porin family
MLSDFRPGHDRSCPFAVATSLIRRAIALALGLAVWLGASGPGAAQPATRATTQATTPTMQGDQDLQRVENVEKVEILGLVSWQPEQILPRLKTRAGQAYNVLDVRDDLSELSRIMRTAAVSTEPTASGNLIVRFTVTEFPRFRKLLVVGNSLLKTERIETLARLKPGDVLDERTRVALTQALRDDYKALGMPQARVTLELIDVLAEPGGPPQADLRVNVEEGVQVLCQDLVIEGNQAFSTIRLRSLLETKGSWWFVKNYYDSATFQDDLDRLRDFCAAHGYFDARIDSGPFEQRQVKGRAVVSPVIRIQEGERYRFGTARVRGARLFAAADVQAPFQGLAGRPFDGRRFAAALDKLRQLYRDHGLLTTEFATDYQYDASNKILDMTINITEGGRIYVGQVKLVQPPVEEEADRGALRGWYDRFAPPVKQQAILREVLLKPGDVYNQRLERDSLRRLANLGIFDPRTLRAYNEPTVEPGIQNLVIEAEQSVTGAISGGVGFGDATGAFLYASFNERNLAGAGDVLGIQATLGTRNSSLSISHLNRHLGESDDSLATRIYYETFTLPGYRAYVGGASGEAGRPLEGDWRLYLRGRLEAVRLEERDGIDAAEDLTRGYGVATVRLRAVEDTRFPYGQRPTEGYLQSYGVEAGYAGGPLLRLEAMRDQYVPLSDWLTWRVAASAGVMPYDSDRVPIHERYFLGGDTDLRGFEYRGAGYFDREEDDVPIGGAIKLLVKNELHFPIFDPVSGVYFVDAGALGRSPVGWQAPRVSTGLGLRFDLRNVQVALDLAYPVARQSGDRTRLFHFSLQSAF